MSNATRALAAVQHKTEELEAQRRLALSRSWQSGLGALAAAAAVGSLSSFENGFAVGCAGALIWGGLTWFHTRKFRESYRRTVYQALGRRHADGLDYNEHGMMDCHCFEASDFAKAHPTTFMAGGGYKGYVDGRAWRIAHVYATRRHGKSHTVLFDGPFAEVVLEGGIDGVVTILPDTAERFLGKLGQVLQDWNPGRGQHVQFEDPTFEKVFVVYASSEQVARRFVTPALQRALLALYEQAPDQLHVSLRGNHLYVGISPTGNLFQAPLTRPVTDPWAPARVDQALRTLLAVPDLLGFDAGGAVRKLT